MKDLYVIPIFIPHIGCPNMCVFCNQNKITGHTNKVTKDDIINTVNDFLATIKNKNATIEFAFFGGSFTGIEESYQIELLSLGKQLIDDKKINYIRISTRPDYINEEILERLKKYGVKVIELGVQSMDEDILKISKRGHTSQDVIKASQLIKDYGFVLGHQMMIGLPNDTYEKSISTAKKLIEQQPEIVRIYPVLVIKETELEIMYNENKYKSLSLEDAIKWCKDLVILFESNNIKVIRVGLQKTERVCEQEDVVTGPFHPSFRELVESEIYFDMIKYCINEINTDNINSITIKTNAAEVSKIIGNNKSNIVKLKEKYNINSVDVVVEKELEQSCIIVIINEMQYYLSKKTYYEGHLK